MLLNKENYFSKEANAEYWSVSQFKAFNRCEAAGLAEARGIYEREETDALLIGSYVDAYFSGELEEFTERNHDKMYSKRGGGLLAKFQDANKMINPINRTKKESDVEKYRVEPYVIAADIYSADAFKGRG